MESEFLERISANPELIGITKHRESNGLVCYSENINTFLIQSLIWIYQNYFSKSIVLFVPKMVSMDSSIKLTLEELEMYVPKKNEIVIFAYFELILKDFNKRRLNTLIKNISKKNKVLIISYSSLKYTQLPFLDNFDFYELPKRKDLSFITNSLFDLVDPDQEIYESNLESFIEFVVQFKSEGKRVYISLNLCPAKLIEIESLLKNEGLSVSRKDSGDSGDSNVVINSCKTTEKLFLSGCYSVFIFAPPVFEDPVELISFFKDLYTGDHEVFIDSSKIKNITQILKILDCVEKRPVIKDSIEFDSYNDLIKESLQDPTMASDSWYLFQCPGDLLKLDLGSLTKKEYDLIRTFVKNKLSIKYDIDVKTCQLAAPCSPIDRSKKLNSLSNKISSFDYRCDCTCEIFKDYTIGVLVWNDFFRNRKKINILKNNTYIYQTTRGTWKYTTVY